MRVPAGTRIRPCSSCTVLLGGAGLPPLNASRGWLRLRQGAAHRSPAARQRREQGPDPLGAGEGGRGRPGPAGGAARADQRWRDGRDRDNKRAPTLKPTYADQQWAEWKDQRNQPANQD